MGLAHKLEPGAKYCSVCGRCPTSTKGQLPCPGEKDPFNWMLDDIIEIVQSAMAMRWPKDRLKKVLAKLHPDEIPPDQGTYEKMRTRARQRIADRANEVKKDLVFDSIAFYEEIIADENTDPRAKLQAQKQLEDLLGAGAKWSQGTQDAGMKTPSERARELRESFSLLEETEDANAEPHRALEAAEMAQGAN